MSLIEMNTLTQEWEKAEIVHVHKVGLAENYNGWAYMYFYKQFQGRHLGAEKMTDLWSGKVSLSFQFSITVTADFIALWFLWKFVAANFSFNFQQDVFTLDINLFDWIGNCDFVHNFTRCRNIIYLIFVSYKILIQESFWKAN